MSDPYQPILTEWYDKFELNGDGEVQLKTAYGTYANEITDPLSTEERMQLTIDKGSDLIRFVNQ